MASPMGERLVIKIMQHTIFIADKNGNDISSYTSIEDAQLHLEVIDVEGDEYVGYDHEGRLLNLGVDDKRKHVVITLAEDKPLHAKELETAILTYLKMVGEPLHNDSAYDLPSIVKVWNRFLGK